MIEPYYDCDGITIYNADCREVLPQLGQFDLLLTDPPYSGQTHKGARTRTDGANSNKLVTFEPLNPTNILKEIECVGWLVATVDWRHIPDFESAGILTRFGVWVKPNSAPQLTGDRPAQGWEAVAICWKGEGRPVWNGGGSRAVWTCNRVDAVHHPTEKPVSLFRNWINLFGGETILDPFMGSGTTLEAAKLEGRKAVGIEINEKYCEAAVNRLAQGVLF